MRRSESDEPSPGWGAGSSAYSRLRGLSDDSEAGGFFDRTDDRDERPEPPAEPAAARGVPSMPPARDDVPTGEYAQPPIEPERAETRTGRRRKREAGRNVPVSIAVGVLLAATVLGVLFFAKPFFVLVLLAAAGVGIWELVRAIRNSGANPPLIPLLAGGAVMLGLSWFRGVEALSLGLLISVLAVFVWRLADGPAGYQKDMGASALILLYVPFLLSFASPLATPDDGQWRILCALAAVVLSDTGGFVAGVLFGKHPMAPTISPKKSWEGFAGSLVGAGLISAILLATQLHVKPWWGALFGIAVAVACVLGDLAESLLKRDLGIKDMSNLLPGHGGLMDRLDSILFALPTAYLLLSLLAPVK
ncbi:phosphatidate cytidylyltransferase [Hamadaea tsunoensis]|uniref:phosphatidate cytidylyltransferase n=1 Tax=Hamadaea tsunoensis TaxID=53368 RepID=UPI00042569FC|nr:phosphatidate cytidylyltransferase [Hamadaea tsunoensis]